MKAYREIWDEENNRFDYIAFEIKHEFDFDSAPETNLYDSENVYKLEEKYMIKGVMKDNERLRSGEYKVIKCKDCGKYFILTLDEKIWFEDRGLSAPRRCQRCRGKRRSTC